MAGALVWNETGKHYFKTGIDKVVLYLQDTAGTYPKGVAWSGVSEIQNSPDGAEANDFYAGNVKYLSLRGAEDFGGTITAYQCPDEFKQCDGLAAFEEAPGLSFGQQERAAFGLSYRTKVGNEIKGTKLGYEIHLVWGATCSPSDEDLNTINEDPDPSELSWEYETVPVEVGTIGGKEMNALSHAIIDSRTADPAKLAALEKILYGSEDADARLPLPAELYTLMSTSAS